MVNLHFCTVLISLFPRGCWFIQLPYLSHSCWSYSALSSRCKLPTWRCRELLVCQKVILKKSDAVSVISAVLPRGYVDIKTTAWKEDWALLRIRFLPVYRIRLELLRRIRHRIFVCKIQRRLAVSAYRARHPDVPDCFLIIVTCDAYWLPDLEPSPLLSCNICWWIQGQPLPRWSTCFLDETIH